MPVSRRRLPPVLVALLPTLLLLAVGCSGPQGGRPRVPALPAGFSADTFTRDGLVSGATADEAGCRALPDGLWVDIGSRRECLRYAAGGTRQRASVGIVHIPGDPVGVAYRFAGGRAYVDRVSSFYEHTVGSRRLAAETLADAMRGIPVFLLARPGMHGASGDHAQDRHTEAEVLLVGAAITELKRRYGLRELVLSGFSSGGLLVANLLARRDDIRCAVIASAPLDLAAFYRRQDGLSTDHFAMRQNELADPMRVVRQIRSAATIIVAGDARDRSVPRDSWMTWVSAARGQGLHVFEVGIRGNDRPELGPGRTYHITGSQALEAAHACAQGWPGERLRAALLGGEPILRPQGRRLDGREVRAAFAGHQLAGVTWLHWGTRVTVSTWWDPKGERHQFHPAHPEQRIATQDWWIEGDRLCIAEEGCHAVLADGRFLHLVAGEPPRFLVSFVADPARR